MDQLLQDTLRAAPLGGAFLLSLTLIVVATIKRDSASLVQILAVIGVGALIALCAWTFPQRGPVFDDSLMTGGYANLFAIIFLVSAGLTLVLSREYARKIGADHPEFYILIVIATTGMMTFSAGLDLIVTFIGLEIMSVSLYILAGYTRRSPRANEAALKYFLLGAFATGFFLYGIALLYGASGSTKIVDIAAMLPDAGSDPLFLAGTGLLLIGFAFKVGAVPFHMWVPDVYEGAPSTITGFMSTAAKSAAFAALLLIFTANFAFEQSSVNTAIAVLAVASMVIGNVVALSQSMVKRMLAYSSIAHAGYMLIGVAAGSDLAIAGVVFYLISYTFTNIGAFGVASIIETDDLDSGLNGAYRGLSTRKPLLAALMAVFMFSLIGLPPLSGFFGKYYIFLAAIERGYTWLTIVGVITSMVSIYFYLRIVVMMYFKAADDEQPDVTCSSASTTALVLAALGVLVIGIAPSLVLDWMGGLF